MSIHKITEQDSLYDNLENLSTRIHKHLGKIYGDSDESKINTIAEQILKLVSTCKKRSYKSQERWTEQSIRVFYWVRSQ